MRIPFLSSPMAGNFRFIFISLFYMSQLFVYFKASKVELLNKYPNVGLMCFSWLASHSFVSNLCLQDMVYLIPPEEPESACNAFCLADHSPILTWGLIAFSVAR